MIQVPAALSEIGELVDLRRSVLVTDSRVRALHAQRLPEVETLVIGRGEAIKTLATLEEIYRFLAASGVDRGSFVLAVGGGVVSDLTGLAASTFKRGVNFGFAPTTLLAQVDASVGGKNGVNLDGFKNLVGTVAQPTIVLMDPSFLATLEERELVNGIAEAVKTAAVGDGALFELLRTGREAVMARDPVVLSRVVEACVRVKCAIVERDHLDRGPRMVLNFGHTIGHAIEREAGLPHGQAIAAGMVLESRLHAATGAMDPGIGPTLEKLLNDYGLPTGTDLGANRLMAAIDRDKKVEGEGIHLPIITELGRAGVVELGLERFREALDDLC